MDGVGSGVGGVHLNVSGNSLLTHEHTHPDGDGPLQVGGGFDDFQGNGEVSIWHLIISRYARFRLPERCPAGRVAIPKRLRLPPDGGGFPA